MNYNERAENVNKNWKRFLFSHQNQKVWEKAGQGRMEEGVLYWNQ